MIDVKKPVTALAIALSLLSCTFLEGLFGRTRTPEPPPPTATRTERPGLPPAASDTPAPPATPYPTEAPPPTPPSPATPVGSGWPCYSNDYAFNFTVCYPPEATLEEIPPNGAYIDLPIAPGTNLSEKWLEVWVFDAPTCSGVYGAGSEPPVPVTVHGPFVDEEFLRTSGGDAGAGNYWEWVSYTTRSDGSCVAMTFTLHFTNPLNYDPPIPVFDEAAESAIFQRILETFFWWG